MKGERRGHDRIDAFVVTNRGRSRRIEKNMEEVSTMMVRSALPGNSLIINGSSGGGNVGTVREHQTSATSRDVHLVKSGSSSSGGATGGLHKTVSILAIAPTSSQPPSEAAGATVFVGAGSAVAPAKSLANSPATWRRTHVPEVQTVNGYETRQQQSQQLQTTPILGQRHLQHQQSQSAHHVVKIRINPEVDTGRVISTVRLTPDQEETVTATSNGSTRLIFDNNASHSDNDLVPNDRPQFRRDDVATVNAKNIANERSSAHETCVRISVVNGNSNEIIDRQHQRNIQAETFKNSKHQEHKPEDMVQQRVTTDSVNATSLNRTSACFYYGSFQNPVSAMVMSSGQCSPSDTLDSGTCSDLDGTPPPLSKKKNSSTVLLGVSGSNGSSGVCDTVNVGQHNRTGSMTSSGADVDSDDNESNISCDSLNSGELAAQIIEQTNQGNGATSTVDNNDKKADCTSITSDENDRKIGKDKETIVDNDKNIETLSMEVECININNNNDHSNKCNNKNVEDAMNVNAKNSGEDEMNERNNGNRNVTNGAMPEVISNSCSTRGTTPSVSPSPSGTSSLSKASSTPRVRSPVQPLANGRVASPVVKECTYEERKREQDRLEQENAAADYYANYNRKNGTKYLYDDDRFYKFHMNENQRDEDDEENKGSGGDKENDEYFAGYKILDREAIRSAKGTVRGVKNRVRAGIATFLQKPSAKVCTFNILLLYV